MLLTQPAFHARSRQKHSGDKRSCKRRLRNVGRDFSFPQSKKKRLGTATVRHRSDGDSACRGSVQGTCPA